MSIGQIPQSDILYPGNFFLALGKTKKWLQDGESNNGPINFCRLLHNMRCRTKFEPVFRSDEPAPPVWSGPFECREPVWKLVHEVASKYAPTSAMSQEECAEWLLNLLELAGRYLFLKSALDEFKKKLSEKKIDVVVDNSGPPAALWIHEDSEVSGRNAKILLKVIIDELLLKVAEYIEKSAKGSSS